jgi:uncharacterized membrane protein YphA (DoxX/SURF4 family)
MKPEPNIVSDTVAFLTNPAWPTPVYWILLLASIVIAARTWRADPAQRTVHAIGIWILRVAMGTMWWQGSLWKIPPNFDGLVYWMKQVAEHAFIPLQSTLYARFVIPNIAIFGPLVYATEALIAVSLILGFATRLFSFLGLLMGLNLWIGLYSAPNEWPWTYGFLIIIQALFVIDPLARSLGLDARPATAA